MPLPHSLTPFLAPLRWISRSRRAHRVEDPKAAAAGQASVEGDESRDAKGRGAAGSLDCTEDGSDGQHTRSRGSAASARNLLALGLLAGTCACGGKGTDSEAPVPDHSEILDTGDAEGEATDSGDYEGEATDTGASVPDRPEILDTGDQTAVGSLTVDGETFRTLSGVAYEDSEGKLKVVLVSHPYAACSDRATYLDWLMMDAPRGEYPGINIEIPEYSELSEAFVWEYWSDSTGEGGQALTWVELDGSNIDQEGEHEIRGRLISANHPQASFDVSFAVPFCGTDERF